MDKYLSLLQQFCDNNMRESIDSMVSSKLSCPSSYDNSSSLYNKAIQITAISLIEVFFCAFVDLLIEVPTLFAILTNTFQFAHLRICSDIPGSTIAFHNAIISLFRTLPEPSNTNIVWTNVPLHGQGTTAVDSIIQSSANLILQCHLLRRLRDSRNFGVFCTL